MSSKNTPLIITIVADIAAGKGTMAQYLEDQYGATTLKYSQPLRDILDRLHLSHTRENIANLSTNLRKGFGQNVLGNVIAEDIKQTNANLVVLDGARRAEDIVLIKDMPNFHLVYLTADPKVRGQRVVERNENAGDAEKSFTDFMKDEQLETESQIDELANDAAFTIKNNSNNLQDFYQDIDNLMNTLDYEGSH